MSRAGRKAQRQRDKEAAAKYKLLLRERKMRELGPNPESKADRDLFEALQG